MFTMPHIVNLGLVVFYIHRWKGSFSKTGCWKKFTSHMSCAAGHCFSIVNRWWM